MTLSTELNVSNQDTFYEWVDAAADETDVEKEVLWNIAEKLLLEPEPMEHIEKELRLKVLYEIHLNRVANLEQDTLPSWIKVIFEVDEGREKIQFSYGQFSVPMHDENYDREAMKKITREEGIEVNLNQPEVMATRSEDKGAVWATRVTKRILDEVYEASIGDIVSAEEEGERSLTWDEVVKDR